MEPAAWSEGVRKYLGTYSPEFHVRSSAARVAGILKIFRLWLAGTSGVADPALLSIRRQTLEAYRGFRQQQGRSRWTINGEIGKLRAFFRWCVDQELLAADPTRGLRRLKVRQRQLNRYVSLAAVAKVVRYFERRRRFLMADLVKVIANTGLRLMEALMLREIDADLFGCNLWVRSRTGWEPKDKQDRKVPINAQAAGALHRRIRQTGRSGLLFPTRSGKPISKRNALRELQNAAKQLGLPHMTFHGLRRTVCIELVNEGWTAFQLKEFMGHEDITTTQGYIDEARQLRLPVPAVKVR